MIIGVIMLLVPIVVFLATLPFTSKLRPTLRSVYRVFGGLIVIVGSSVSIYFAAYSGDQGGIAAFFFQIVVLIVYLLTSLIVVAVNWFLNKRDN